MYLKCFVLSLLFALVAFAATADAQEQLGPQSQQQLQQQQQVWISVRTPWYPGKNLARGLQGAFGYSVPPRYWSVPVQPTQPAQPPAGFYFYRY